MDRDPNILDQDLREMKGMITSRADICVCPASADVHSTWVQSCNLNLQRGRSLTCRILCLLSSPIIVSVVVGICAVIIRIAAVGVSEKLVDRVAVIVVIRVCHILTGSSAVAVIVNIV